MAENLRIGLQLLVLGMGTVFFMLILLSFLLKVSGNYFENKRSQQQVKTTQNPDEEVTVRKRSTDKEAKVAAVMAAVQAVMGGNSSYKVTSIKKRGNSDWQRIYSNSSEFNYGGRKGK